MCDCGYQPKRASTSGCGSLATSRSNYEASPAPTPPGRRPPRSHRARRRGPGARRERIGEHVMDAFGEGLTLVLLQSQQLLERLRPSPRQLLDRLYLRALNTRESYRTGGEARQHGNVQEDRMPRLVVGGLGDPTCGKNLDDRGNGDRALIVDLIVQPRSRYRKSPFLETSEVQSSGAVSPVNAERTPVTAMSAPSTSSVTRSLVVPPGDAPAAAPRRSSTRPPLRRRPVRLRRPIPFLRGGSTAEVTAIKTISQTRRDHSNRVPRRPIYGSFANAAPSDHRARTDPVPASASPVPTR